MNDPKYKIVGLYEDKKITLDFAADDVEAHTKRAKFAASFSSSWKIKIEPFTENL